MSRSCPRQQLWYCSNGFDKLRSHRTSEGRYDDAERLYLHTLDGRDAGAGPVPRYQEAEPLFRRVLVGAERALEPNHAHTLGSLNNLAALREDRGRYSEAEPLYRRALAARDRTVGRAEALRRAMLGLIDQASEREAHPAYWAPFVMVGEGRAG